MPAYASVTDTTFTDRLVRVGATISYFITPYEPTIEIREGPLSATVSVVVQ